MGAADDLTGLLTQLTKADTDIGYRSGIVTSWNAETGENTITIAGAPIANVPFLIRTEALAIKVGDVVGILRVKSQYFVLGRISVGPGEIVIRDATGTVRARMGRSEAGGAELDIKSSDAAESLLLAGDLSVGEGVILSDASGATRLAVAPIGAGHHISIYDDAGGIIVGSDAESGQGLARPYLNTAMYPARSTAYEKTTNSTYTALWRGRLLHTHPKVTVGTVILTDSGTGTSGDVRVTIGGTVVASESFGADTHTFRTFGPVTIPSFNFYSTSEIQIQARRTAGTGSVGVGMYGVERVQS